MVPAQDEPSPGASARAAAFDLHIDHLRREVRLNGTPAPLGGRAFDLLATMVAQPGRVFAPDELVRAAWPGRVVDETNLRAQVRKLRQALGAEAIVNVSGRGYAYAAPAGARRLPPPAASLPSFPDTLFGRDEDIGAVTHLLAVHRIVTLLGPGGIGKTRLALAVAEQFRERGTEGLWWIDLAPLQTPEQIATAIAQAGGVQTGSAADGAIGPRLAAALAGSEGLLVLDNAEHVVEPLASLLHTLWQQAQGLVMLVTSQQRLQLRFEQVYRLEPLATQPALQLLLQRAQAVDQRFRFHEGQIDMATALCQRLDGIPLALELAGTRLPMLGLEALNQHLGERLRLLGAHAGMTLARHGTLQAALSWSHGLLSEEEKAVLRRLSVFAAPFRLEAAQHVAADAALDAVAVVQAVSALVDKSLLQPHAMDGSLHRRYRLLETTRVFAARELDSHREREATEARHARAMAQLADRAQASFWTTGDDAWQDEWHADHDDFMLGFDRAFEASDAESAAVIGEALHAMANINGVYDPIDERAPAALALLPLAGPLARARLWNRTARRRVPALSPLEATGRRVQAWRLVSEPMGLARALAAWAPELESAGDAAAVDAALRELRLLEQAHWPPRQRVMGVPVALLNLANLRDDNDLKHDAMRSWLALAQAGGLRRVAAQAWGNLARVELRRGHPQRALNLLHESTAEYRAMGCQIDAAYSLGAQAEALLACGAIAEARHTLEQALLQTGDSSVLVNFGVVLAALALQQGDLPTAARMTAAAATLNEQLGGYARGSVHEPMRLLHAELGRALEPKALAALQAEGVALDAPALRKAALEWLR